MLHPVVRHCLSLPKRRHFGLAMIIILFSFMIFKYHTSSAYQKESVDVNDKNKESVDMNDKNKESVGVNDKKDTWFYDFKLLPYRREDTNGQPKSSSDPFKRVENRAIFLYSAIANEREPAPGKINLIITAFDSTGSDFLLCCMLTEGEKLHTTQASVFFTFRRRSSAPTKAKQYACVMPQLGLKVSHVTLTNSTCPRKEEDYLPVVYPHSVPQGLALCAKTAYGSQLDPHKLMEWFEIQRLLGVDHIQLMDLDNPEPIQRVFRYYKQMGLLNILPYRLPGIPYGRGLDWKRRVHSQFDHDETFSLLDCVQRLRGYTFMMGHDLDEVLMPAKSQNIKDLLKEQFMRHPDAAGFLFFTQYFIYDWGPQNKDSDVQFFRFLNSTWPRKERWKWVCITSRIEQVLTHSFTPRGSFKKPFMPKKDAVLHHYRKCPGEWRSCNPPQMTDKSILRFQGVLEERLSQARKATGLYPSA